MFSQQIIYALVVVLLWYVDWYMALPELVVYDSGGVVVEENYYGRGYVLRKVQVRRCTYPLDVLERYLQFLQFRLPRLNYRRRDWKRELQLAWRHLKL